MIFKGVRNGKPYRDHGLSTRDWAKIPPRQFRLDQLTTVTTALALDKLLSEDSTFYGDLFAHVVRWHGEMYLEDGLHRAVRSALRNRHVIHARLLDLDALGMDAPASTGASDADAVTTEPIATPQAATGPVTSRSADPGPQHRRADAHGWTEPPDRRAAR
ncbi:type II toxin-antitoxin system VapB family antitoxin [Williamsia deligens]|uniref:Type II toxin-antitoxin system VapB family antitoxin n=1 Tax=Williamsia deligens TaxID=321325 RepID=A0ABW3G9W8_9NOCA|nr:type II toxin-antitoxin system VapB family antitoxin [Williamsia deligens]MCP2195716.1 Transcription regulator of the Arc/MetJ class [Williamsia deligens]